jgi:hypothetical protein
MVPGTSTNDKNHRAGRYSLRPVRLRANPDSQRLVLLAAGFFVILFGILAVIQFSTPNLAGTDGHYHIKFAALMRAEGLTPDFPYLPLTVLNEREFYDHHLLFHLAQVPFTFGDLVSGAKWASVVFASLAFLTMWLLLRSQGVPYASLWTLGLVVISEGFLYRMSMPRAQSLSVAILGLALLVMFRGRHRWLLLFGFLYVWTYNAFPLLLVAAGCYTIAVLLVEHRWDLRPLFYAAGGILLGLVINPYFPDDIVFIVRHLLPKLADATAVQVGNEWFPYSMEALLNNTLPALVLFAGGILALGLAGRRMSVQTATSLLLALLTGFMLLQARRFVEYFPPFALLFAAFASADMLRAWLENRKINHWLRTPAVIAGGLVLLALAGAWTLPRAVDELQESRPSSRYGAAARYLAQVSPAGARVFQTDWDDFPRLFFHNTHNTYLIGLDPTYMQQYDSELYDTWAAITRGEIEDPAAVIAANFGSQYVFSDTNHDEFLAIAAEDPGLVEIFRDEEAVVFAVQPSAP